MYLLTIDIGTYSVKFARFKWERREISLLSIEQVLISSVWEKFPDWDISELQAEIIKDFINTDFDRINHKIVMQIPSEYITTRSFELPSTNKRKIDMMIPFQLDDNLPFPTSEAHYATQMVKKGSVTSALVNIIKEDEFADFHAHYAKRDILPDILTSGPAVVQSYMARKKFINPFIIVDIGHKTSKGYAIKDFNVITSHVSYTAGEALTNVVAQTYKISEAEALKYKQENGFFLTEKQYSEVTDEQREFANIMREAIYPLILDLKRWVLGFRVQQGIIIESIYLAGGCSQIKNIENFFTEALAIPCKRWKTEIGQDKDAYFLNEMMAEAQKSKQRPGNLLTGLYAKSGGSALNLRSSAFIGVRLLALCLIYSCFLIAEGFILNSKKNQVYSKVSKRIKLKKYGVSKKYQRHLKRRPVNVLKRLEKTANNISRESEALYQLTQVNAVAPLAIISREVQSFSGLQIKSFVSDGKTVKGEFTGHKKEDLVKLSKTIKKLPVREVSIKDKAGGNLALSFKME